MDIVIGVLIFISVPLLALVVDGLVALRSRSYASSLSGAPVEDFTILVPIYGNTKYLENVDYLATYGDKVILCTTGDESETFYRSLRQIAEAYRFRIFRDVPARPLGQDRISTASRATSGATRDRLIRNVLSNGGVSSQYVVPLDADTFTSQPLSLLVGELAHTGYDLASIKLVLSNREASPLTHIQFHEYQIAMALRFIFPWMISGACHVAKTQVLNDIMSRHSLFFQGNDMEVGLIAKARNYHVGHIPFEVFTAAPATFQAWFRQRLAWGGGEFRLFIPNWVFVLQHTYLWMYGGVVVIVLVPLRWLTLLRPSYSLLLVLALYYLLVLLLHWDSRDRWLLVMPVYSLFLSLVITPLGIIWYFVMAARDRNYGIIAPGRHSVGALRHG